MAKEWYKSKTLWGNVLATTALLFTEGSGPFGHVFAPEEVAMGYGLLNTVLRLFTGDPIKGTPGELTRPPGAGR